MRFGVHGLGFRVKAKGLLLMAWGLGSRVFFFRVQGEK